MYRGPRVGVAVTLRRLRSCSLTRGARPGAEVGCMERSYSYSTAEREAAIGGVPDAPPCPHEKLLPCWDGVEPHQHGLESTATSFWCEACGTPFTPFEAAQLRRLHATAAARPHAA